MEPQPVERGREALRCRLPQGAARRPRWGSKVIDQREGQRLVVEYNLYDDAVPQAGPRERVIAKFYSDDMGERSFRIMQELAAALDALPARPPVLAVPRPLFYDPTLKLLVQERVEGTPYVELLPRRAFRAYLRVAGRALACLHRLPTPPGEARGIEQHIADLMRPHPLRLGEAVPAERARIEALVDGLIAAERAHAAEVVPARLHRDFHMRQLFHRSGRLWLIDWDLAAYGDPALDLGNFLVNIRKHAPARAPAACDAFLEGYFAEQPAAIGTRVPIYESLNCLRRACKAFRLQEPGWRRRMTNMLLASEQCLASL